MSESEPAVSPAVKPRRSNWKSLAIGLVIFISGMIIGSGLTVRILWVKIIENIHNTDRLHDRLIHRAKKRLDLTEEQIRQVHYILQKHQNHILDIRKEIGPKIITEFVTLRDDIDAILTPSQSEKWHRWLETTQKTWLKPFVDLHPIPLHEEDGRENSEP